MPRARPCQDTYRRHTYPGLPKSVSELSPEKRKPAVARGAQLFGKRGPGSEYGACWLQLKHPTPPKPLPALALLDRVVNPNGHMTRRQADYFKDYMLHPAGKIPGSQQTFAYFLADTVLRSVDLGRVKDAAWIISFAKDFLPSRASAFDGKVRVPKGGLP